MLDKAQKVCVYTLNIVSNPKTFAPELSEYLTKDIAEAAKDIFIKAKNANRIRVEAKDPQKAHENYIERMELQEEAIGACNDLLSLIQIARKACHLSTRRVEYWGKLTVEAKEHLVKWHESDLKRYAKYKQQDLALQGENLGAFL